MAWAANYPLNSTIVKDSTDQKRNNWAAIENWFNAGHVTFPPNAKHRAGHLPVLFYGTHAQIAALSDPPSGAIAFATDLGVFEIHQGSWKRLTEDYFSRFRDSSAGQSIPHGTWTVIVNWQNPAASGLYDTLDEFGPQTFVPKSDGYYTITFRVTWDSVPLGDFVKSAALYVNGTQAVIDQRFGIAARDNTVNDIFALFKDDIVLGAVYHNRGSNLAVTSARICASRIS